MSIGMTYNEYWYGDPLMVRDYYRAFRIRRKQEDERMWLQGLYVLQALQATVGNLFLSDGEEPNRYPEEPILQEKDREKEEERKAKEEEREQLRLIAYLNQVMEARKGQQEG